MTRLTIYSFTILITTVVLPSSVNGQPFARDVVIGSNATMEHAAKSVTFPIVCNFGMQGGGPWILDGETIILQDSLENLPRFSTADANTSGTGICSTEESSGSAKSDLHMNFSSINGGEAFDHGTGSILLTVAVSSYNDPSDGYSSGTGTDVHASGGMEELSFVLDPGVTDVRYILTKANNHPDASGDLTSTVSVVDSVVNGNYTFPNPNNYVERSGHEDGVASYSAQSLLLYAFTPPPGRGPSLGLPGSNTNNPLPPITFYVPDNSTREEMDSTVDTNAYTGTSSPERAPWKPGTLDLPSFTAPVVSGGYGQTETVYFDPELAIGYGYFMEEDNRFLSFEVPDPLPQGDDTFEIHHLGVAYPLLAGETFDFTTIDPLGVNSFLLVDIDEAELIDADGNSHPPFVFGATFADEGIASFSTFALVAVVPEPTTLTLAVFGMLGIVCCRRSV